MRHERELHQAVHAAEHELRDLDHAGVLLITEVGDYGLQIAIGDRVDHATVKAALRGAADRLDGGDRPIFEDIAAALRARGWKRATIGTTPLYRHERHGLRRYALMEAVVAQAHHDIA